MHLNYLNARSRGLFNLNQLLYCVSLNIYNKFANYEGWNFNSGNYLFTNDIKWIHVSKFYCPSV